MTPKKRPQGLGKATAAASRSGGDDTTPVSKKSRHSTSTTAAETSQPEAETIILKGELTAHLQKSETGDRKPGGEEEEEEEEESLAEEIDAAILLYKNAAQLLIQEQEDDDLEVVEIGNGIKLLRGAVHEFDRLLRFKHDSTTSKDSIKSEKQWNRENVPVSLELEFYLSYCKALSDLAEWKEEEVFSEKMSDEVWGFAKLAYERGEDVLELFKSEQSWSLEEKINVWTSLGHLNILQANLYVKLCFTEDLSEKDKGEMIKYAAAACEYFQLAIDAWPDKSHVSRLACISELAQAMQKHAILRDDEEGRLSGSKWAREKWQLILDGNYISRSTLIDVLVAPTNLEALQGQTLADTSIALWYAENVYLYWDEEVEGEEGGERGEGGEGGEEGKRKRGKERIDGEGEKAAREKAKELLLKAREANVALLEKIKKLPPTENETLLARSLCQLADCSINIGNLIAEDDENEVSLDEEEEGDDESDDEGSEMYWYKEAVDFIIEAIEADINQVPAPLMMFLDEMKKNPYMLARISLTSDSDEEDCHFDVADEESEQDIVEEEDDQ